MNKIDLLFVTHNRLAFTEQSYFALQKNTNWNLVDTFYIFEDSSIDGTRQFIEKQLAEFKGNAVFISSNLQMPVAIMNHFLKLYAKSEMFAKIDNDVIVPPQWLDKCINVMQEDTRLDLLGIEPTWSRTQAPWKGSAQSNIDESEARPGHLRYIPCAAIGGIGLMRRRCFESGTMTPHSKYGGFTDWQWKNKNIIKGWIAPALKLFLLDRLPHQPWSDLSRYYEAKNWQRAWTRYSPNISHLWDWWEPVRTDSLNPKLDVNQNPPQFAVS